MTTPSPEAGSRETRREVYDNEPLGLAGLYGLGRLDYDRAEPPLGAHDHGGAVEICYLARGRQTYVLDGTTCPLRGGDVFLTFPGETHGTGGAPEEKSRLYWLILGPPGAGRPLLGCPAEESRALWTGLVRAPVRRFRGAAEMGPWLDGVFDAIRRPDPFAATRARVGLLRFLLAVIDRSVADAEADLSPGIRAATAFVRDHPGDPVDLRDLAAAARLSLSHFKRVFKKETGIPPREYVLREKVDLARRLLRETDRSVTEIAFDLGFTTSTYFATVFKQFAGRPPSAWRAAARAEKTDAGG